jgi:glycosyltransferase involved in cell wall biosynthesis
MIRVGMILSLRGSWLGGINYFRNLLQCYKKYPDPEVKLAIFAVEPEDLLGFESDVIEVHSWPEIARKSILNLPGRAATRILGHDPALLKILRRQRIDLLTYNTIGRQKSINTLYWQPDFQHKAIPDLFSEADCANRDSFVGQTKLWGNILLSSHAAAADFRRYYPELVAVQTRVLHFSSAAVLDVEPLDREALAGQYPTKEPYFYLPNHFWKHKNHAVVIEALRLTRPEIRVICTGSTNDWRDATYYPRLMDKVREAGLSDRFVALGTVPYPTVVSLMHHSIAVIQPSLFEGWSTTVEEAKAMRKQIVLSNIDVHLEQAPERGVFFSPDSPEELASCLERSCADYNPVVEETFTKGRSQWRTEIERDWVTEFARIVKAVA